MLMICLVTVSLPPATELLPYRKRTPYSSPQSGFFRMHLPADQARKKLAVQHIKARPITCVGRTNHVNRLKNSLCSSLFAVKPAPSLCY